MKNIWKISLILLLIITLAGCSGEKAKPVDEGKDLAQEKAFGYEEIQKELEGNSKVINITWSNDRTKVAYTLQQDGTEMYEVGEMYLWQVGAESPMAVNEVNDRICGYKWSSDGNYVLADIGTSVSRLGSIVDANSGKLIGNINYIGNAFWSPAANQLLFAKDNPAVVMQVATELNGTTDLYILDVKEQKETKIFEGTEEYYVVPVKWINEKEISATKYYLTSDGGREESITLKL